MIFFAYANSEVLQVQNIEIEALKKMKIFFAESVFERRLAEEPTLYKND